MIFFFNIDASYVIVLLFSLPTPWWTIYKVPQSYHGTNHYRDHVVLLLTALNSPMSVGVKLVWK